VIFIFLSAHNLKCLLNKRDIWSLISRPKTFCPALFYTDAKKPGKWDPKVIFVQKNQNFLFIAASALLFDKKIRPSAVQTVFQTRLEDPKPSSELKCMVPAYFGEK
jgi:hypothetical protein